MLQCETNNINVTFAVIETDQTYVTFAVIEPVLPNISYVTYVVIETDHIRVDTC